MSRKTDVWVSWMVDVYREAQRVCKGLVAFVVAGQTRKFRWSAGPVLLMAELHKAGMNLRNPPIFHRIGIPGSGGPDWLRGDYEWIVCTSRPGKLPWSDNTACGHPPKWAPGGEMSHRTTAGSRVNQWGHPINSGATVVDEGKSVTCKGKRPSHKLARRVTRGSTNGDTVNSDSYDPPALANPGTLVQKTYTADEVAELLAEASDVTHHKVGGGLMGHPLAHGNEAPFPETLADFFIKSFCPPGGIACDVFSGSGTTAASAVKNGRRFIGCDLRESQVEICRRRLGGITPSMFHGG